MIMSNKSASTTNEVAEVMAIVDDHGRPDLASMSIEDKIDELLIVMRTVSDQLETFGQNAQSTQLGRMLGMFIR
jgi:hypothetical protein